MKKELIQTRIDKAARLRESGINPYPYVFDRTHETGELLADFDARIGGDEVSVAGRVMALRPMGKVTFAHLQDAAGRMQLYFRKDDLPVPVWEALEQIDLGDLIGVRGAPMRTRSGEATLQVRELAVLAKSIRPLPVVKEKDGQKFDAWEDTGNRYRRRHLDFILNPEHRRAFETRAKVVRACRAFLDGRGFLEVETPVLQSIYGGAMARPFVTHHNALDLQLYLRIALELPLKKLLVGGMDRVYEIGHVFRNEGIDRSHSPEFTMLEFYWAYADYHQAMDLVEAMLREVLEAATGSLQVEWDGRSLDFSKPIPRRRMVDLIEEKIGLSVLTAPEEELRARLVAAGESVPPYAARGHLIEGLFDHFVQPELFQPIFVTDHPRAISPLAKIHRDEPELVERFEIFIGGVEFGNAFSELNDPVDQRARFEDQAAQREKGDLEAQVLDEEFLQAIEHGMPPAAGVGIGIDRLAMLAAGVHSLRDILLFPQMRPEEIRAETEDEE
ncbi:MAG: lysine--tRNA ligase [Candidatus Eisenbacteria bacterium]|uniref:Lysine--tRNA ligase n=1 Tax=Eiseniibacteriota bacterium TaxID=2212470 RepID=A0A956M0K5_UNCEI|nr:lysine--tRNA ligase [Candidatus Eisenbacteria bacterium]